MIRKKYLAFLFLIVLCVTCFTMGLFGLNTTYAMKQTITFEEKISDSGLSGEYWVADNNGDNFAFVSESKNFESTVSSKDLLKNNYSVTFNFGKVAGSNSTPIQMIVALGAQTQTKIPIDNTVAYFNTPDDNTLYLAFTGTKVYVFDRTLKSYQDKKGGSGKDELGSPYWKHLYDFYAGKNATMSNVSVKLEVVCGSKNDTLNLYFAKSNSVLQVPDCSITLHKKGVANGYLQFSQAKSVYNNVTGSYSVNDLRINDKVVRKEDVIIVGRENLVKFTGTTKVTLYDKNIDSIIISKFRISDSGLRAGQEVFSLTFTSKRFATPNTSHNWGLVLGVDDSNNLSTGKQIIFAENGVRADTNGGRCDKHCDSNINNLPNVITTYNIKGYVGGKVEVSYNDYSTCKGHTAVYNNVDFNGKVAFKIFNDSGLNDAYWEISNVSFDCSVNVDRELELKLFTTDDNNLIVGDEVKLTTNMDCNFEIVEGTKRASLDGDTLTAISAGKVVVKASLINNPKKTARFTFNITENKNYNFKYNNSFESTQKIDSAKNTCDFYVINSETGEIGINNVLYFKNTAGETPAQVSFVTPFTNDYQNGIVFDITFTVTVENSNQQVRNKNYTCGFAFGLDEIDAKPLTEGSGAILINCSNAKIYNNGLEATPTYVTQNQEGNSTTYGKDSFGCFADSTCPLTVRLVAKADGTLEFYRGIIYSRVGEKDVGTYISDLFATYSGFDFNGYVSFFTNNKEIEQYKLGEEVKNDDCDIQFDNLIIKGNYRLDKNLIPEIKDLGISNTMDLLHTELPIDLEYYIYTVPNLEIFHGYKVEVVSGNATIDSNNRLLTTGAGKVTLRIISESDLTKFKEIELNIGELKIEDIDIEEKLFENLSNDSQAFFINAKLKGENTYITKYLTIDYQVLEGDVSIIDGYLYINGAGNAKIRVYSRYLPSVEKIIEFNVMDGDLQYQATSLDVNSVLIIGGIGLVVIILLVFIIVLIVKKVKRGMY